MAVLLNPYLNFDGFAREAMTFYQSVFGGELQLSTFGEFELSQDENQTEKIMHSLLRTESGLSLMGADVPPGMEESPNGSIALSGDNGDEQTLRAYWAKLSEGGVVSVPLEKAPWGDFFGMLKDKFGVDWLINIAAS